MKHKLTWYALALAGLLGGASVGMVACAEQRDVEADARPECALPVDAVSPELLAFLSKARASHLRADLAEKDEDIEAALSALDELSDGALPGGQLSPEVREVLADTLARTAELRSGIGQFDEAKADVQRGLLLASERTHYRGRLMEVLGAVEARLHDKLVEDALAQTEAGASADAISALTKQADAAKQRAIEASLEAIDIQEEVINEALAEDPGAPVK